VHFGWEVSREDTSYEISCTSHDFFLNRFERKDDVTGTVFNCQSIGLL
jgi:hypothetical protein